MDSRTRAQRTFAQRMVLHAKKAAVAAIVAFNLSGCGAGQQVDHFFNYPPELEFTI
ncbi:hypothetical protein KKF81_03725 [Candidatus Micrarchaeota archaeon]|nr:hypothetical protein [Candidatus Micrarchaeota archaeon]MBU1166034.1 hypothetical protein [Candidatus Micrarchaeota archaeon]MBU1886351.1 hypothetical protein [Candidatus Micrarchaeota archaeon]